MRRTAWRWQVSDDGRSAVAVPRDPRPPHAFGEWARSPTGDVTDRRAFDAHMLTVGEEDQTAGAPDDGA